MLNKTFAFITPPIITALCLAIFSETLYPSSTNFIDFSIEVTFGLIPLTYLFVIIIGLPSIYILRQRSKLSIASATLSGFIAGLIAFFIIDIVLLIIMMNTNFSLMPFEQGKSIADAAGLTLGPLITNRLSLWPATGLSAALGAFLYAYLSDNNYFKN